MGLYGNFSQLSPRSFGISLIDIFQNKIMGENVFFSCSAIPYSLMWQYDYELPHYLS